MSTDLAEKLATPPHSEGRARATLAQLKSRLGFKVLATDTAKNPVWVRVGIMEPERWRKVAGSSRGAEAIFEVEEGQSDGTASES